MCIIHWTERARYPKASRQSKCCWYISASMSSRGTQAAIEIACLWTRVIAHKHTLLSHIAPTTTGYQSLYNILCIAATRQQREDSSGERDFPLTHTRRCSARKTHVASRCCSQNDFFTCVSSVYCCFEASQVKLPARQLPATAPHTPVSPPSSDLGYLRSLMSSSSPPQKQQLLYL